MRLAVRRPEQVLAVIAELRERHSDLVGPLTWHRLRRVLALEGIPVLRLPMFGRAKVLNVGGVAVIAINPNVPERWHTPLIAHEWAHVLLHAEDADEVARHLSPCRGGDPREWEADLFRELLMGGSAATLEHPDVATIAAKLEKAARQLAAVWIHVPAPPPVLPDRAPCVVADGQPRVIVTIVPRTIPARPRRARRSYLERPSAGDDQLTAAMRYAAKHPLRIRRFSEPRLPRMEQVSDRTCYFLDEDGRKWRVHDVATAARGKHRRLPLMSDWPTHRVFVPKEGPWRWYKFVRREGRGLSTGHLAQQWAAAELRLAGVA